MIMNRNNFLGYFFPSHHLSVFIRGSAVVFYSSFFSILLMLRKSAKYFQMSVWKDKYDCIMNTSGYFLICTFCSRSFHVSFFNMGMKMTVYPLHILLIDHLFNTCADKHYIYWNCDSYLISDQHGTPSFSVYYWAS